jgi:hypothetical protein
MEIQHYIYGLYSTRYDKKNNPNSNRIRYIGKSGEPFGRLKTHIRASHKGKGILHTWIRNEIEKGGEIKLTILHQCGSSEITEQEKKYIEKHKTGLLNIISNPLNDITHLRKRIGNLNQENISLKHQMNDLLNGGIKYKQLINEIRQLKDQVKYLSNKINKQ